MNTTDYIKLLRAYISRLVCEIIFQKNLIDPLNNILICRATLSQFNLKSTSPRELIFLFKKLL